MRAVLAGLLCGAAACSSGGARSSNGDGGSNADLTGSASSDLAGSDGAVPPGSDLSMPTSTADVTIIVEPSDDGDALVAAINAATTSVHMTMYLLTDDKVTNALLGRKKAGLDVKVVLNQTFPDSGTSNQAVYDTLKAGGVGVVWAPSTFTYTHEKCFVIDGTVAWINTMNSTASAPSSNREYLAIDKQAADVAEAESIFEADYAGTTWSGSGALVVSPVNSRDRLVALIGTATSTIDVEDEELSDTKIVTALTAQKTAGRTVRVVLSDESASSAQVSAVAMLKQHGIPVVSLHSPNIHAKAIVVDGATAYVGSENLTTGSLLYNRELGLTFSIASEVKKVGDTVAKDFAAGTAE